MGSPSRGSELARVVEGPQSYHMGIIDVLQRTVGEFIVGLDQDNLKVGVTSGEIVLTVRQGAALYIQSAFPASTITNCSFNGTDASVSSVVIDPTTVANPTALPNEVSARLQQRPNVAGIVVGVLFGVLFFVAAAFVAKRKRVSKLFPSGYKVPSGPKPRKTHRLKLVRKSNPLPTTASMRTNSIFRNTPKITKMRHDTTLHYSATAPVSTSPAPFAPRVDQTTYLSQHVSSPAPPLPCSP